MTDNACVFDQGFIIAATLSSRILVQFIAQIVGLTVLRRTQPSLHRPFRMWLSPIASVIVFLGFALIFISSGVDAVSLGAAWFVVGAGLYLAWAKAHREWPFGNPMLSTALEPGK